MFGRTTRNGTVSTPRASDVFWLEGALAGLLSYVHEHMRFRDSEIRSAALTLSVQTLGGEKQIALRVPVR